VALAALGQAAILMQLVGLEAPLRLPRTGLKVAAGGLLARRMAPGGLAADLPAAPRRAPVMLRRVAQGLEAPELRKWAQETLPEEKTQWANRPRAAQMESTALLPRRSLRHLTR